jgi:hypothetical protein
VRSWNLYQHRHVPPDQLFPHCSLQRATKNRMNELNQPLRRPTRTAFSNRAAPTIIRIATSVEPVFAAQADGLHSP